MSTTEINTEITTEITTEINTGMTTEINTEMTTGINTGIKICISGNDCNVSYSTEYKGIDIFLIDYLTMYINLDNFDPTKDAINLTVTVPNRIEFIYIVKMIPFNEIQDIINHLLSNSEELRELLPWIRFLDEEFKLKMLKCFKFCKKLIVDLSTHRQMYEDFDILLIEDTQKTTESIIIMYNSLF
jgi:hypothetical protein